jgi:hypothetical protein
MCKHIISIYHFTILLFYHNYYFTTTGIIQKQLNGDLKMTGLDKAHFETQTISNMERYAEKPHYDTLTRYKCNPFEIAVCRESLIVLSSQLH